jgi:hypothetical protein
VTVYVDDFNVATEVPNGRRVARGRWSHLFCDDGSDEGLADLHVFATRLGLRRAWFQDWPAHRFPHYDVTAPKRAAAVRLGAVQVSWRESAEILRVAFPPERYRALRKAAEVEKSGMPVVTESVVDVT